MLSARALRFYAARVKEIECRNKPIALGWNSCFSYCVITFHGHNFFAEHCHRAWKAFAYLNARNRIGGIFCHYGIPC